MSHERHEPARHADHKGHSAPQAPSGDASPAAPAAHIDHGDGLRTERIPLSDLYCACCAEEIAPALKASPHIVEARLDWQNDAIEVTYHAGMISREEIEELIRATSCCSVPAAGQPASMMHVAHRAQMAPVTMGTKHDRMQYELPSSGAHAAHGQAHQQAKSHASMDHDMSGVVLMKSDPLDVLRAIRLSKATVTKMKQNLFWASIYNLLAIPIAAGALYPSLGVELRPEWAALLMAFSSLVVAINAVLLKRVDRDLMEV